MAAEKLCVFNLTRQSFLSFGVSIADTHFARLRGLLGHLRLLNDDGLWLIPCQGIHTIGVPFPIDVVYLDETLRVVHLIEHFAPFRIAPVRMRSSSVLELSTQTVFWSNTRVGDQFLIGSPEELADYWSSQQQQSTAGGPRMPHSLLDNPDSQAREPAVGLLARITGWFKRQRGRGEAPSPDVPPVCAYYWEGGGPAPHDVLKISEAGAFLRTAHPWDLATIIELTLQPKSPAGNGSGDPRGVVRLSSLVVRSDPDGIDVRFIYAQPDERRRVREFLAAMKAGGG